MGLEPVATETATAIQDAGFPVSVKWDGVSQNIDIHGAGTVDVSFDYSGAETDSNSLGNAMQDAVNANNSFNLNFESADGGNTTTGLVNETVIAADKVTATVKKDINAVTSAPGKAVDAIKAALPSPTTAGLYIVGIGLLALAVYSFAGGAGESVGAKA